MIVHANLDCEARWAGIDLPRAILERISLYGTLLAPPEATALWTPAPVDPSRLQFAVPALHVGIPPRADLHWAHPSAAPFNDRRWLLALGLALPGTRAIGRVEELDDQPTPWIAKAIFTAAGRDRVIHTAGPLAGEARNRAANLLARFGTLVVEPWCTRTADYGQCATLADTLEILPPHTIVVDARGGFTGIDRAAPVPTGAARAMRAALDVVAAALAARGYRGPFAIDAFAHTTGFHAACEINARHTFGRVAHALAARHLGFTQPPPPNARVLVTGAAWML